MSKDKRILELALQGLEAERRRIEEEMVNLQKQLSNSGRVTYRGSSERSESGTKRNISAAGRKAISDAMKKRWANFRKTTRKK